MSTDDPIRGAAQGHAPPAIASGLAMETANRLSRWFSRHSRVLPWRRPQPDPYAVMVSELMLQQTQVATVIPYFINWMQLFPTFQDLAHAPEESVVAAWSGLGYYRRARSLRLAAQVVCEVHRGALPPDMPSLIRLPGIGRYTAGAILSIAFDHPIAAVDGNVVRVLSRFLGVPLRASAPAAGRALEPVATAIAAAGSPRVVNQALMEIGALICRPDQPRCDQCPLAPSCMARAQGQPTAYPLAPARREVESIQMVALMVRSGGAVLMTSEPVGPFWRGLWHLPTAVVQAGETPGAAASALLARIAPAIMGSPVPLGLLKHAITYRRITLHLYNAPPGPPSITGFERWVEPCGLGAVPHPAPHARAIRAYTIAPDAGILKCRTEEHG